MEQIAAKIKDARKERTDQCYKDLSDLILEMTNTNPFQREIKIKMNWFLNRVSIKQQMEKIREEIETTLKVRPNVCNPYSFEFPYAKVEIDAGFRSGIRCIMDKYPDLELTPCSNKKTATITVKRYEVVCTKELLEHLSSEVTRLSGMPSSFDSEVMILIIDTSLDGYSCTDEK